MQLNLERPDYSWFLRGADGTHALVNDRVLVKSFCLAPDSLIEDWPVPGAKAMTPTDIIANKMVEERLSRAPRG